MAPAVITSFRRLDMLRSAEPNHFHRRSLRPVLAALLAFTLAGCASTGPSTMAPGTPRSQVQQSLGLPTAEFDLRGVAPTPSAHLQVDPSGRAVRRVEYGAGSFGKQAYLIDFDANDRVLAAVQARSEARFNAILAGMGQDELRRVLGVPSRIWALGFQKQNVWSYRYDSPFCQWFMVGVGYDGRVVDTAYGPDPLCDDDTFSGLLRGPRGFR
jgi:hypothetical protein